MYSALLHDTAPDCSSPIALNDPAETDQMYASPIGDQEPSLHSSYTLADNGRFQHRHRQQNPADGTPTQVLSGSSISSPHCRYCLGRSQSLNYSEADDRESLVGPCRCKGTMGLVHPGCLTRWLQLSRKHRCELCGFDLRQCDRHLMPELAQAAIEAAAAEAAAAAAAAAASEDGRTATAAEGSNASMVAPDCSSWLREPDQICCLAVSVCCLVIAMPLVGVLIFFLCDLHRVPAKQRDEYQVVLFELLIGFVSVGVIVWLVYGTATCIRRYQNWRQAVDSQREMTVIVALEEAA